MFTKTLRALTLAAAVMSPLAAMAQPVYQAAPAGPSAVGPWTGAVARTPLASNAATPEQAAQRFLELSGATGNLGQHS